MARHPGNRAIGIHIAWCRGEGSMKQQSGDEGRGNGHAKVLVVDDDDEVADVVRQVLREAGYSVATVRHGAQALELVEHIAPDLILLDLSMPIMDGWSFVTQYRRSAKPGARIFLLTANPQASQIAETLRADGYIQKPFDIQGLVSIVGQGLSGG
jgi:CheY-like chemotaxis protein